jgi:hypothetical protein
MGAAGFAVEVRDLQDLGAIKAAVRVPVRSGEPCPRRLIRSICQLSHITG